MNRTEALELQAKALAALSSLPCHVTLDGATAASAAQAGNHVVIISPPRLEFPTWHQIEAEFTIWLVAGPNHAQAWERMDKMLELLAGPLELETATPETLTDPSTGAEFPAYRCTTTDTYYR